MILQKSPALAARQYLDAPTEFKFKGDTGTFEGYASIFGKVDLGGDRILPGAFKDIKTTRDGKVLVLLQHRPSDPIGKADFQQDSRGLLVHGDLMLDDPVALSTYRRMKTGLLDAMSIGYDVLPGGATMTEDGIRELSKLRLWEVSVVTWGMNQHARIDVVKSATECKTIREFEHLVRDALGLSKSQAGRVATAAWPAIADRDDLNAGELNDNPLGDAAKGISDALVHFYKLGGIFHSQVSISAPGMSSPIELLSREEIQAEPVQQKKIELDVSRIESILQQAIRALP